MAMMVRNRNTLPPLREVGVVPGIRWIADNTHPHVTTERGIVPAKFVSAKLADRRHFGESLYQDIRHFRTCEFHGRPLAASKDGTNLRA
jgi:hypothetical protein